LQASKSASSGMFNLTLKVAERLSPLTTTTILVKVAIVTSNVP